MLQLFHGLSIFEQPLALITNIIAVVSAGYVIISIINKGLRYRRRKKLLKFTPSAKGSVAISIGVGLDPTEAVKGFLAANSPDIPLIMAYSKLGNFSGEELLQIFEEIKSDFFDLMQKGDISEILLFYGGPVTLMAPIGAIVDNWVPVKLFGREEGKYIFQFTLNKELIKKIPSKYRES